MNTKISRVIAVCGSNTLRSITLEKVLQLELSKTEWGKQIQVTSAGVRVGEEYNQPADEQNAAYMLQHHGIQLEGHRSRYIEDVGLTDTDLIVVVSGYVDTMIVQRMYNPKTYHYLQVMGGREIDTPYYSSTPDFAGMKRQIDRAVQEVQEVLQLFQSQS